MHLHALLLLGAGGAFLGFLPAANALIQPSNQARMIGWTSSAEKSSVPSAVPCPEDLRRIQYEPLTPGPTRLAAIRCLDLPRGQKYHMRPVVSPDGDAVAFWSSGQDSPLDVLPFDGSPGFRLSNRVTFRHFGSGVDDDRQQAIAWRSDGSGLWSVEQQVARPSGFALSGLTPTLIGRDAKIRRFTPPKHSAGPLDAIAWVGSEGRAIAQFGTRGNRYRPEHEAGASSIPLRPPRH